MSYMNDIYERINLQVLTAYITSGKIITGVVDSRSYDERLFDAQNDIDDCVKLLLPEISSQALMKESIEVHGDVKFEIGFKTGLMLAMELITNRNF